MYDGLGRWLGWGDKELSRVVVASSLLTVQLEG